MEGKRKESVEKQGPRREREASMSYRWFCRAALAMRQESESRVSISKALRLAKKREVSMTHRHIPPSRQGCLAGKRVVKANEQGHGIEHEAGGSFHK